MSHAIHVGQQFSQLVLYLRESMSNTSESLPSIIADDHPLALGDSGVEVEDADAIDNDNYGEELFEDLGDTVLPSDYTEAYTASIKRLGRHLNGSTGFAFS